MQCAMLFASSVEFTVFSVVCSVNLSSVKCAVCSMQYAVQCEIESASIVQYCSAAFAAVAAPLQGSRNSLGNVKDLTWPILGCYLAVIWKLLG